MHICLFDSFNQATGLLISRRCCQKRCMSAAAVMLLLLALFCIWVSYILYCSVFPNRTNDERTLNIFDNGFVLQNVYPNKGSIVKLIFERKYSISAIVWCKISNSDCYIYITRGSLALTSSLIFIFFFYGNEIILLSI